MLGTQATGSYALLFATFYAFDHEYAQKVTYYAKYYAMHQCAISQYIMIFNYTTALLLFYCDFIDIKVLYSNIYGLYVHTIIM